MSLLLDALKRAEQEKHGRAPDRASDAPRESAQTSAAVLELQPVGGSGAAGRNEARAAKMVFDAKSANAQAAGRGRGLWLGGAAVGVVLLLSVAAYVWYAVSGLAPRPVTRMAPSAPSPFTPSPPPPAGSSAASTAAIIPDSPGPAASDSASNAPAASSAPAAPPPAPATAVDEARRAAARAPERERVQLERSRPEPTRVPVDVQGGYDALVTGDLTLARTRYSAALKTDPVSVDAQLGLAVVEARSGDRSGAVRRYQRVLEIDPGNPTALAGLASLTDLSRPSAVESELRTGISGAPRSAALQSALGDVYAAQGRWVQAQAAYFEAYRLNPSNADVAYNIAVSLDHLGQRRVAADFYRRALEARRGSEQFDAATAARRVGELEH